MTATILAPGTVAELVGDAVTAPSMHNAQPWKFVFSPQGNVIELHGDPDRAMTRTDPHHRALHLGCAAALFNLRVSAVHHGLRARVRLLPDGSRPWLLATAALDGPADQDRELAALHTALRRRHTSRFPFGDEPVPDALMDGLKSAARLEGCRLTVPGDWHIETVLGLVRDAEHREDIDPLVRAETSAWASDVHASTGTHGTRSDGIPTAAFGPRSSRGPPPYATSAGTVLWRIAAGPCSSGGRSWPCWAPLPTRESTGCGPDRHWNVSSSRPPPTAWPPR